MKIIILRKVLEMMNNRDDNDKNVDNDAGIVRVDWGGFHIRRLSGHPLQGILSQRLSDKSQFLKSNPQATPRILMSPCDDWSLMIDE